MTTPSIFVAPMSRPTRMSPFTASRVPFRGAIEFIGENQADVQVAFV
jgi:hypothetical protein